MSYPPVIIATTRKRTALQIVQQAMGEIGMSRPTTLVSGNDETATQLLYLLNGLGEKLCRLPLWTETRAEWLITTLAATTEYELPADWLVPLVGTTWDRTGRWPLLGPKTPTEWQYLQSGFGVAAPQYRFRFMNGRFVLFPAPAVGLTLVHEYLSANWVVGLATPSAAQAGVFKSRITADTDYPILDELMLITGLKLAFREAKGLDASKVLEEFEQMLEAAWANSNSGSPLSLAPIPSNIFISEWNLPDTGYGQ